MTDIVERLRDGIISRGVQVEAAYEIVRLRAALEEINVGDGWAAQIARAARGEKA